MGDPEMIEVKIEYHDGFIREATEWSLSFGSNIEDRVNLGINYIEALEKLIRDAEGLPKEMEIFGDDPLIYRLPLAGRTWVLIEIIHPNRRFTIRSRTRTVRFLRLVRR